MQANDLNLESKSTSLKTIVLSNVMGFLVFLFALSLFVQVEVLEAGQRSLVGYHVVLIVAIGLLVADRLVGKNFWATRVEAFSYVFMLSLTLPAVLSWEIGLSTVLLIFAFLAFLLGVRLGKYSEEDRLKVYQLIMLCFVLATILRNVIHIGDIGLVYSRQRGCTGCFLATGGRNIEGTMLSILALLYRGRYRVLVGIFLTLTVVFFQSRIGLIGAGFYWFLLLKRGGASVLVLSGVVLMQVIVFGLVVGLGSGLLGRFDLSQEIYLMQQGVGRLSLWSSAIEALQTAPFGVGPGNAVPYINRELIRAYWENNIHNAFLTWILELGWFHGGGMCLVMIISAFRAFRSKVAEAPAIIFIIFSSLIQFTGYDAIFWFLMGVFISSNARRPIKVSS